MQRKKRVTRQRIINLKRPSSPLVNDNSDTEHELHEEIKKNNKSLSSSSSSLKKKDDDSDYQMDDNEDEASSESEDEDSNDDLQQSTYRPKHRQAKAMMIKSPSLTTADRNRNMLASSFDGSEKLKIMGDHDTLLYSFHSILKNKSKKSGNDDNDDLVLYNKKRSVSDYMKPYLVNNNKKNRECEDQEEKERIYDSYFQIGMARRTLARKRKRGAGGDDNDNELEMENHFSETMLKNLKFDSPLTNTESMRKVLDRYASPSPSINHQLLYQSWNSVWNETHICAKKIVDKTSSNILVAGYGSKLELLNRFVSSYLALDQTCFLFVLAGYDPIVSIRGLILQLLLSLDANAYTSKYETDNDIIQRIHKNLSGRVIHYTNNTRNPSFFLRALSDDFAPPRVPTSSEVYICVHNLESAQLQSAQAQKTLSLLCSHPQIHLIASVDHPMSSLMWDSPTYSLYNFQYFWVESTNQPYLSEAMFMNKYVDCVRVAVSQSKENRIKGLESILKSFGHQLVRTFQTLVTMIYNGRDNETRGYSLEDICTQVQTTTKTFVNEKTIKNHLIKMQGNDLVASEIVRGKSIYCLTKHYHKILDAVYHLCKNYEN